MSFCSRRLTLNPEILFVNCFISWWSEAFFAFNARTLASSTVETDLIFVFKVFIVVRLGLIVIAHKVKRRAHEIATTEILRSSSLDISIFFVFAKSIAMVISPVTRD